MRYSKVGLELHALGTTRMINNMQRTRHDYDSTPTTIARHCHLSTEKIMHNMQHAYKFSRWQ